MSIADTLYELECDGNVHRIEVQSRKPLVRRLYMTAKAYKDFENDQSAVNFLVGRGYIRSTFTKWLTGERIYASENGKKGKFLKELDPPPPNTWEIRVTEPTVQARIIGSFPEPDTFVVTGLYTRTHLGKKGSKNWKDAMDLCESDWKKLGLPTFRAKTIGDYVTEKCDDFPLKR